MGIGTSLTNNIKELGLAAMFVVILSVVLLKFKDISSVTAGLNTTIDTFVTAFSEPANWALIIVIVVVAVGLFALFKNIKN